MPFKLASDKQQLIVWTNRYDGRQVRIHGTHDDNAYWLIDDKGRLGTMSIKTFRHTYTSVRYWLGMEEAL